MAKLTEAIRSYQKKLEAAEGAATGTIELLAGVLIARDQVHLALNDSTLHNAGQLVKLTNLDERLRSLAPKYQGIMQVTVLRDARSAPGDHWWWQLGWMKRQTRTDKILNGLTSLLSVFILGLVLDIAPRFIGGGSDTWGIMVIGLQGLVAVFAANTLYNREGDGLIDVILKQINIPSRIIPIARTGTAILAVTLLLGLRAFLPTWSQWDNNQGMVYLEKGELQTAEVYFNRSIRLDNNNYQSHYNLGTLFDVLGEYGQARAEYTIAAKSGFDLAYNNLSRLLVLQGEYAQAVQVTQEGLSKTTDPGVRYFLNKNLGWARLKQERFEDAIAVLQEALKEAQFAGLSGVEAHCLLAQVLEMQGRQVESQKEWYQCKAQVSIQDLLRIREMDEWQYLADQHLKP